MSSKFEEYKEAVKARFEAEKHSDIGGVLMDASRKNLKKICLSISELSVQDKSVYHRIFEIKDQANLMYEVGKSDLDTLRPLESFMKGKTKKPDDDVIELLAILVNFQPRPFTAFIRGGKEITALAENSDGSNVSKQMIESDEGDKESIQEEKKNPEGPTVIILNDDAKAQELGVSVPHKKKKLTRKEKWVLAGSLFLLAIAGGLTYNKVFLSPECMVWKDVQYEATKCDAVIKGEVVSYDEELLRCMKKIYPTDTTTFFRNAKPVVWYSKQDNAIEFFTCHGRHPVTGVTLKAVTRYMVQKYAVEK